MFTKRKAFFLPEVFLLVGFALISSTLSASSSSKDISSSDLLGIFNSANFETARDPVTHEGRAAMQSFLNWRLASIVSQVSSSKWAGGDKRNQFLQQSFQTKVFVNPRNGELRVVEGKNFIVVFEAENRTSDSPLLLLASYDTEESETNALDDNGSGVVALISLAERVAHLLTTGRLVLDRSLILAFTDVALAKHEAGVPDGASTGAEELVQKWLGPFMQDRRGFSGAIVLDSLMNYNDEEGSQVGSTSQYNQVFSSAYSQMTDAGFKGNFLALVHRESSREEKELIKKFRTAWRIAGESEMNDDEGGKVKEEKLVDFSFSEISNLAATSPVALHFLKSEQAPFWNNAVSGMQRRKLMTKQLPAILITDTEKYRKADCTQSGCTLKAFVTPRNLAFLRRTVNSLFITVKMSLTDNHEYYDELMQGVGIKAEFSIILTSLSLLIHQILNRL